MLEWADGKAAKANGTAPPLSAVSACGSAKETYLSELLHTGATSATVLREWGDIVPGGRQIAVSGTVRSTHLGPSDLPMSHIFGDDLSMDIAVERPFLPFVRSLGPSEQPPGELHVEISSGLIPHKPRPSPASPSQTWREMSDFNLTGFQPGFGVPDRGDRVLAVGRWIIDCGHDNFQTELHPLSFVAFTHTGAATTSARLYQNPYRDSQLYSPDASMLGRVTDDQRLRSPDVKPLPAYLADEVFRAATGRAEHLRSQELLEARRLVPPPFDICTPSSAKGRLDVRYDIVTRPGVDVRVVPEPSRGCARVTVALSPGYRPADVTLRQCSMPWAFLQALTKSAIGSEIDVRGLIDRNVPTPVRPIVDRDPDTTCADALAGPEVSAAPAGRKIRADGTQPVPFYGIIQVARSS